MSPSRDPEIVGGEPVADRCPDCGSAERFYHCWPHGVYPTLVTCLDCGLPYKTRRPPAADLNPAAPKPRR